MNRLVLVVLALIHCQPITDETSVIVRADPELADAVRVIADSAG
jgi:hypothetical protein